MKKVVCKNGHVIEKENPKFCPMCGVRIEKDDDSNFTGPIIVSRENTIKTDNSENTDDIRTQYMGGNKKKNTDDLKTQYIGGRKKTNTDAVKTQYMGGKKKENTDDIKTPYMGENKNVIEESESSSNMNTDDVKTQYMGGSNLHVETIKDKQELIANPDEVKTQHLVSTKQEAPIEEKSEVLEEVEDKKIEDKVSCLIDQTSVEYEVKKTAGWLVVTKGKSKGKSLEILEGSNFLVEVNRCFAMYNIMPTDFIFSLNSLDNGEFQLKSNLSGLKLNNEPYELGYILQNNDSISYANHTLVFITFDLGVYGDE